MKPKYLLLMERNLNRMSILQRLLHIVDFQLAVARKERKKLYMAIYDRQPYVREYQRNYVKKHCLQRRAYHIAYNTMHAERLSAQNKLYYQKNKEHIKARQKIYDQNKRKNY